MNFSGAYIGMQGVSVYLESHGQLQILPRSKESMLIGVLIVRMRLLRSNHAQSRRPEGGNMFLNNAFFMLLRKDCTEHCVDRKGVMQQV